MNAIIKVCECGYKHMYFCYRGLSVPDEERCGKCGKALHVVKPGELGRIKVVMVSRFTCPSCDTVTPIKLGKKSDDIVCKVCGYKNGE